MDWHEELRTLEGWHFGGKGSGIEDELADLVKNGIKTATCSWYESYLKEDVKIPEVGTRSYILNSKDLPVCVVEITQVEIKPFLGVDAKFAYDEGEGDRSYKFWREAHETFFLNEAKTNGLIWNPETQHVVCERFKVLHIFK